MESLHEAADQLDALIEDCAVLAETTANDSVRVAAIKERHALMEEKIRFQQACGLLPRNLRLLHTEQQMKGEAACPVGDDFRVAADLLLRGHTSCHSAQTRFRTGRGPRPERDHPPAPPTGRDPLRVGGAIASALERARGDRAT